MKKVKKLFKKSLKKIMCDTLRDTFLVIVGITDKENLGNAVAIKERKQEES